MIPFDPGGSLGAAKSRMGMCDNVSNGRAMRDETRRERGVEGEVEGRGKCWEGTKGRIECMRVEEYLGITVSIHGRWIDIFDG
jgi:hypothetical protein